MANYSLAMVSKIKHFLDYYDVNYSFVKDDDEAAFNFILTLPEDNKSVFTEFSVIRDEDDADFIMAYTIYCVDYGPEEKDLLDALVEDANKYVCSKRNYFCKMYVIEREDEKYNFSFSTISNFDEKICFENSDEKVVNLIKNVLSRVLKEYELISPALVDIPGVNMTYEITSEQYDDEEDDDYEFLIKKADELRNSAENGIIYAQVELGKTLLKLHQGEEIPTEDSEKSPVYWFEKASEKLNSEALYQLALCYQKGKTVSKNPTSAELTYKKICDNFLSTAKTDNQEILWISLKELDDYKKKSGDKSCIAFPARFGKSVFENFDDIIKQIDTNPDALGLYSRCSIFGAGVYKAGTIGIDGLFHAADLGSIDAVLGIGQIYECGLDFFTKDYDAAVTLYKYAYSLNNIDALNSLGFILFNLFEKKEIGLSMMRKAAELGSDAACNQLELIKDRVEGISYIPFERIPKEEFEFSDADVKKHMQMYSINMSDEEAIKDAILDIMMSMKPQTFSVIMNEFRIKYLHRRKLMHFAGKVDFMAIFNSLVKDGLVETQIVNDYGVVENTIYIAKGSKHKMKSVTLDWDI